MRTPRFGRPSAAAIDEMRRNSAQYCNSISVACFVIGVLTPVVRLLENGGSFAVEGELAEKAAAYLATGSGMMSLGLFAGALFFRLRSIYMLWPINDAKPSPESKGR